MHILPDFDGDIPIFKKFSLLILGVDPTSVYLGEPRVKSGTGKNRLNTKKNTVDIYLTHTISGLCTLSLEGHYQLGTLSLSMSMTMNNLVLVPIYKIFCW